MLKLQYFGHLMWRADSFEKTLVLGKIEGRRRRGWQRMTVGWHHQLNGREAASAEHSRERNGGPPVTTRSSGCVRSSVAVQGAAWNSWAHLRGCKWMPPSSALECSCMCHLWLSQTGLGDWVRSGLYGSDCIPLQAEDWNKRPVFQPNMPLSHPYWLGLRVGEALFCLAKTMQCW